jgi:hypothetical protein
MTSKVDDHLPMHTPVVLEEDDPLFLRAGVLRTRSETTVILSVSLPITITTIFDSTHGIPILRIKRQSRSRTTTSILYRRRVPTGGLGERQLTGMVPRVRTVSQGGDGLARDRHGEGSEEGDKGNRREHF